MDVGGARDQHATCLYGRARHMFESTPPARVIRLAEKRRRVAGHCARISNHCSTRGPINGGVISRSSSR
ncbi:hypothetical protein PanWU01x14_090720 [Parasponia andersonii]|uniref:Uncharacterized protein n=1 Tax=Parasponia andersonii TaxID=3476 RepID=A0A2P5D6X0_PARAD|nr:hypothetical protein PanWU01x14_090720 [Parasponia andersonii]